MTDEVTGAVEPAEPGEAVEIRAATVLPARREEIGLRTADGIDLVGELAQPLRHDPVATLIMLHPLPTHGGMMDSHVFRKAAYRLPALADLAVLRFNTRGTSSERGTSGGAFDGGRAEGKDVAVEGAILLSPPLHRAGEAVLDRWAASGKRLVALIPELDDYLRPADARVKFARVPQAEVIAVLKAKHLWVGETYVRIVLNEIVRRVNPSAWPLPTEWKDRP
jgi:hypothetical protein